MASPSPEEKRIGSLIIGNLNKDGYVQTSLENLAQQGGVTEEDIEEVLFLLQTFDPIGVCAFDLKECLMLQAHNLAGSREPWSKRLSTIISITWKIKTTKHMPCVESLHGGSHRGPLTSLPAWNPNPAALFSDEEPQYITPDIYVYKTRMTLWLWSTMTGLPKLKVNAFYKQAIQKTAASGAVPRLHPGQTALGPPGS